MTQTNSKIIGIDLGTTNSVAAIMEGSRPRVIENAEANRLTPSVVAVTKSGERLVGTLAKRQAVTNPENTIFSVKRLMGRRFSDPEVQKDIKWLPYKIREAQNGGVEVQMGGKWYSPQEISAMILQKIKHDCEDKLGQKIERAVITVPAYFDDSQRKATKDAGEIAGFKVERILNEPTAAALAYGLDKNKEQRIIVYDFGGGTFDISILEVSENTIEVKGIDGDTHLGGDDFDKIISEWIVKEFLKQSGIDLSKDTLAIQRIREAAEKAKIELSSSLETEINLPFITSDASGPKHLLLKMTRATLENLTQSLVDKSIEITKRALDSVKLSPSDINEVVLVGGQTKMPLIQRKVEEFFGKKAHKDINPDEVVAVGAAIQAGILTGEVRDILLLDVTPLTLGIETLGGVSTPIIEKHTTIPFKKSQIFTTAADNQTSVEIHILQGERPMAADNKTLGRFILDGIAPAPRGVPQIEVTYDIDANGILNVTAKDLKTGKSQSIRIESSSGLSKEEIERMKQEAQIHYQEDQKKKELVEIRNKADALIYSAEKSLNDFKDKIPQNDKNEIEDKIKRLKEVMTKDDKSVIENAMKELELSLQKIGNIIYGSQQDKKDDSQGQGPQEGKFEEK
jgi:molecular chaperone DnaK